MRLDGKLALVTGGLRGIGRAIVERFIEEGARVFVVDLDDNAPEFEARDLVTYARMDVTGDASWTAIFADIDRRFGQLDVLINNAGASRTGSIASASEEDWRFVMDTNALSVFLGCRHAVAAMEELGGVIVNIASARGLRAG